MKKTSPCGAGRTCDSGWECIKGNCQPKYCPRVPCKATEICRRGKCVEANCCKGDLCGSGKTCNNESGKCMVVEINAPSSCTLCTISGGCAQKSQRCITLTDKTDRLCASECTASKKCGDPEMVCTEQKDKRWFCIPRVGTCDPDRCKGVKCGQGELCNLSSKTCVKIGLKPCEPCEYDVQCGGPTDTCIRKKGEKTGFCSMDCGGCATCPDGYACKEQDGKKLCLPVSGSCSK